MKTKLYVITTLSHLHVGSGEYSTGVIDNLVQRDLISELPNIHSSSLKGALREFFDSCRDIENKETFVRNVFGSEPKDKAEQMQPGSFRFFEASMLSYPVRSDKAVYFRALSPEIVNDMRTKIEDFGIRTDTATLQALKALGQLPVRENEPFAFFPQWVGAVLDDLDLKTHPIPPKHAVSDAVRKEIVRLFGNRVVLMHPADLLRLCGNNRLPVVSRNYLEKGESKNLWYEEVVPRFTQFYFTVIEDEKQEEVFERKLTSSIIQIGANASIGYGFSKIQSLSALNLENYEN